MEDFTPPDHFHANDMFKNLSPDLRPPFRVRKDVVGDQKLTDVRSGCSLGRREQNRNFMLIFGRQMLVRLCFSKHKTITISTGLGMLEGEKLFTLYHPAHRKYIEREENEWVDLLYAHPLDCSTVTISIQKTSQQSQVS